MPATPKESRPRDKVRLRFHKKNITLVNRRLTLPNGKKTSLDMIIHPGAVLMVPFLDKKRVVILRQFRPAIGKYQYEFPAGTLEPGEAVGVCARRELQEEIGYDSRHMKKLGAIFPIPAYSNEIIYVYKAEHLVPSKKAGDEDEVLRPVIMTIEQLKKIFRSGHIQDSKTIAAMAFSGILR